MTPLDSNECETRYSGSPVRTTGLVEISRLSVLLTVLLLLVVMFVVVRLLGSREPPDIARIKVPFNFLTSHADPHQIAPEPFAYLLVHPGYLDYEKPVEDELSAIRTDQASYGDYEIYLENLRRLITHIEAASPPVIWAIEERRFLGRSEIPASWYPEDNALILVTKDMSGKLQESFRLEDLMVYQSFEAVKEFLLQNGILEIRCAGELGWYDTGQALGDGQGCLTVLSRQFRQAGFETKGVSGCIFPLSAPPTEQYDATLYNSTIPAPALPQE